MSTVQIHEAARQVNKVKLIDYNTMKQLRGEATFITFQ